MKYDRWYKFLEKENLFTADELEPIIKGDMIREIFDVRGKVIGILLESLIEKQISQPELTKDEALSFLHKKREEFPEGNEQEVKKPKQTSKQKNKK